MSKSSEGAYHKTGELTLIESLIKDHKYKDALAEIREKEAESQKDKLSSEGGWLSHLASKALQGLGRYEEGLKKAQAALEAFKSTSENEKLADIQFNLGIIYSDLGDLRNSELQFKDAASTYRRVEDKRSIVRTYSELSRICFTKARYSSAIDYLSDGLECCEEIRDQRLAATLAGNLGTVYMLTDRWESSRENLLKSLELNKACGSDCNVCRSYLSLAYLSLRLRQFPQATEYLSEAYQLIYDNGLAREEAIYHEYAGELAFVQGEWEKAEQHYAQAVKLGESIAPKSAIISQAYRLLAELQTERGELEGAFASYEKSLTASKTVGERLEEALAYRTLGRIYSQNGHPDEVKRNFSLATAMLEEMGVKFEQARTYLYMSKSSCFSFWEKMKFLGRAEDLVSQLDSPYYLALVHAAFAQIFFHNGRFGEAKDFCYQAKRAFEQLGEQADLESLSVLEKKLEAAGPVSQSGSLGSSAVRKDHSATFSFADIVTRDRATLEILENAKQTKDSDIAILLEGETGTGKDLLAKVIHHTSHRKNNELVVVSCAAVPEGLFESELFGHRKGSFTGAVADKRGLLDEAVGGTLYLDEIGEVPLPIQVKLLRAIEEKEIVRIGEVKPRKVDFRVIAATNRDLDELVREGKFRSDLFYRLNAIRLKLPALREKKDDIPLLVEHFLKKHWVDLTSQLGPGREQQQPLTVPSLDPRIMELFMNFDWPGNVRQLENEVKKLLLVSNGEPEISFALLARSFERLTNGKTNHGASLAEQLAELEKQGIEKALAQANGVKTKAAQLLGMDEAKLRFRIKKHNITYP
ncbi:MAG: sigma 54-interacting transcriptional regulator [Candidatus Zixiibacteriota bacterium]